MNGSVVYVIEGCWSCEQAMKVLPSARTVVIGRDVTVGEVLEDYPQMACENCPMGIKLPVVVMNGDLVGSLQDLMDIEL